MSRARDISKLLSTTNGKIAGENLDVSFENISDTGTEGTKVASGTTAQRGSTTGQWRFNSTTGYFEGKGVSDFITLEPTPTVTSVDVTTVDPTAGGTQTFVITGTNFSSGGTITFIGTDGTETNATSTTFNSATQVTAVTNKSIFTNANEPYKIKFTTNTNSAGQSGSGLIYSDQDPSWTTASGNVGNVLEGASISPTIQLSATDPDGDSVTFSETTSALGGAGFSLSTSGAITGTAQTVNGDTTTNFTVRATANGKTADRSFNITTKNLNSNVVLYDGRNLSSYGNDPNGGNGTPNTYVTASNGDVRSPTVVTSATYLYGHYNPSNVVNNKTGWYSLLARQPQNLESGVSGDYSHVLGNYYNGSHANTQVWTTLDFGANPSFKFTKVEGYSEWRNGTANLYLYGTNDISGIGNTSGNFGSTNGTTLFNLSNPAQYWDSGTFTNNTYYRYYIFRNVVSGSFDWGYWNMRFTGDYY